MLKSNGTGSAEYELEQNYAVEYAKRNIKAEAAAREELSDKIDKETESRQAVCEYLSGRIDTVGETKADKTLYASTEQYGLVKLKKDGGIIDDGGILVNTGPEVGTTISDVGTIEIVSASEADIDEGKNSHKPIVPSNFKYAVQIANTYSTTPQKVGVWIDGTPIWRMVIERNLTDKEKSNGYLSIDEDVPFTENTGSVNGIVIDSHIISTYSDGNIGEGNTLLESEPFYYTGAAPDHGKIVGWIEFATAKENLVEYEE